MPCLPCRGLLCHLPGCRAGKASLPQAATVVQTAPLVTAAAVPGQYDLAVTMEHARRTGRARRACAATASRRA